MSVVSLVLPFPPSTNTYYRKWRNRMVISEKGRAFKEAVARAFREQGQRMLTGLLRIEGVLTAPDRRRRDLDNFDGKALLDSLKGLVYADDSQVFVHGPFQWHVDGNYEKVIEKPGSLVLHVEQLQC